MLTRKRKFKKYHSFCCAENMIPYDVRKHTGFLRFLVIRIGVHTNQVMVNLVTAGHKPKVIKPLVDALINKIPNIKSIVNTINTKKSNIVSGTSKLLYGEEFINEKIGDYTFKISSNSFFQTNSYQVKTLYNYIIKIAAFKKNDIVYDLYCGTGTIGIYIARLVKQVYGIEIVEDAIKDAILNAKNNNIDNFEEPWFIKMFITFQCLCKPNIESILTQLLRILSHIK